MANEKNWVKILINELGLPSTADFCRKTDLGRGLVDKLSAGDNQPRFDTLVKIKEAFPQVNMNWLVSGSGEILDEVLDDGETVILEMFRKKVKVKNDSRLTMSFLFKLAWFVKEEEEWDQMEINSKAIELEEGEFADFGSTLLLKQRQRRLVSEVLQRTPEKPRGLLDMKTRYEELKELLDQVNNSILSVIDLYKQKE
jgi:hypothetical protein|tara:strand:+ start:596 stop:1189 length:594 start_codon:yes stop_codon:yes gene_type:complete